jgi:hypothetical protein
MLKRRKKMPRKYPYFPSFDGKKTQPGTAKLIELCQKKWKGTTNLGAYSNRLMRNSQTAGKKLGDPGMEKFLSVHATGAACDVGYPNRKVGLEMWEFFINHTKELGLVEIHDYAFDENATDKKPGFGRGYRSSRGEGMAGVKNYDAKNNAGSFGGQWHHFELDQTMAKDAAKLEAAFRAVEAKLAGSPAPAAPAPAPAATPASSGPAFPGDLDVGSKGASVKLVQAKVGAKADGDFGPGTGAKVSAWREANGLGKGTKIGPKTWKAMFG